VGIPKRPNEFLQERGSASYAHAALTATTTDKFFRVPRKARLERVTYFNKTGLAADASNYFAVQVKNGSTVCASWSTQTGAQGALTADTPSTVPLSATAANLIFAAGDVVSFAAVEAGTATLPAGHIVAELLYLE
jgi:hypothetical protein